MSAEHQKRLPMLFAQTVLYRSMNTFYIHFNLRFRKYNIKHFPWSNNEGFNRKMLNVSCNQIGFFRFSFLNKLHNISGNRIPF